MTTFTYRAFGMPIRSEIELPELLPADPPVIEHPRSEDMRVSPADIALGPVPERLDDEVRLLSWLSFSGESWLLTVPEVGRFLMREGRSITIDRAKGAHDSDVRTYLLGTALATIMLQRGMLPLHVSALLSPKGAIAFTGPSGAGKSTAAATLHAELGWPIISDDVAVVSENADGGAMVEGGVFRLRLWSDAMERLNWPTEGLTRDIHRYSKFVLDDKVPFVYGQHPLWAIYEIDPSMTEQTAAMIEGAQRFQILMNAIHRPFIAARAQNLTKIQTKAATLSRSVKFFRGPRPSSVHIQALLGGPKN